MYARNLTWGEIIPLPADLLLRMPQDGYHYALYEGVLVREPMTAPKHGGICHRLSLALGMYAQQTTFPHAIVQNTLFDLTPPGAAQRTVLAPDLAIMRGVAEPVSIPQESPLIAVEVVSESQTLGDLQAKARIHREAGTDEVWIIDPHTRQMERWNDPGTLPFSDGELFASPLLPGFSVAVAWLLDGK